MLIFDLPILDAALAAAAVALLSEGQGGRTGDKKEKAANDVSIENFEGE